MVASPDIIGHTLKDSGESMKTSHKVSFGICDPGTVNGEFAYQMIQLARTRSDKLGPFVRVKGSGLLSKLRNQVIKHFLDSTDSDWLLMMDADELLSVANFDLLCATAHEKERPVVSALVFAAFGSPSDMYYKPVPAIFQDAPEGFLPLYKYDQNSVFEINACGTGCMLIHRSVLEKFREVADANQGPDWCWFWDGPINGKWISEDLLFSRRIRSLGFPIYVHTGVNLPHYKNYWLTEKHHLAWKD
jgi:hypothetical protein